LLSAPQVSHGRPKKKTIKLSIRQTPLSRSTQSAPDDDLRQMQYGDANSRGLPKLRILHGPSRYTVEGRRIGIWLEAVGRS